MIRVTTLYPNETGKNFDWNYYTNKHLPLLDEKLSPLGLIRFEIDKGISAPDPNAPPPFVAVANLFFNNVDDVHNAFRQVGRDVMGDIPNYTDIKPQFLISEVITS
jgi:uncharacterized protein (TIGR02118 family)